MKPVEEKPTEVFRIIDRKTGEAVGSYTDVESINDAIFANCNGIFEARQLYKIAKYRVTYELINDDCS